METLANYKPGRILDLHHAYAAKAKGRCWCITIPGDPLIVATVDPAVVDHILVKKFPNYEKGPHWRTIFNDLLGTGIFNADGAGWKKQRKVASHEFAAKVSERLES